MVCKKSEYRNQFKKPSWETHFAHYQEKVDYRNYRRLVEYRHNFVPWDWDSSSCSSSSSCRDRPQTAPNFNNSGGGVSKKCRGKQSSPLPQESTDERREVQERLQPPTTDARQRLSQESGSRSRQEKTKQRTGSKNKPQEQISVRPSTSSVKTKRASQGKAKLPWNPPMMAYGWADSGRNTATKLTYNVKSSAHPAYVHPGSLRAMKRREMLQIERQKEVERIERESGATSRAIFSVIPARENIWMTEYQSNYCATNNFR